MPQSYHVPTAAKAVTPHIAYDTVHASTRHHKNHLHHWQSRTDDVEEPYVRTTPRHAYTGPIGPIWDALQPMQATKDAHTSAQKETVALATAAGDPRVHGNQLVSLPATSAVRKKEKRLEKRMNRITVPLKAPSSPEGRAPRHKPAISLP